MLWWLFFASVVAGANADVKWGGFIDSQYAYDFNAPPKSDRVYTTQPTRNSEFNINLAYVEAKFEMSLLRHR